MKERILFWDILKGLSVISIVLGYSNYFLQPYLYTYHIALLFFVGAYFYDEEKYVNKPFEYGANLFRKNWSKYVFYSVLLVCLHNFNVRFGLCATLEYYDFFSTVQKIVASLAFSSYELFVGAMWFVPVGIATGTLMALVVCFSHRMSGFAKNKARKYIKDSIVVIITIACAWFVSITNVLSFNVQLSLLLLPVCVAAYFLKKIAKNGFKKYLNIFVALAFGGLTFVLVKYTGYGVDISMNIIPAKPWYYFLVFLGIYVCMTLAKYIEKIHYLRKGVAFVGKHAFSVIALCMITFKLCDRAFAFITGEKNPAIFGTYITAYPDKLWWVYLVAATILPAAFGYLVNRFKAFAEMKIKQNGV